MGGSVIGGVLSSNAQGDAANTAANAQTQSAQLGVDEQRRQFDAIQGLLKPFVDAGGKSLNSQMDLTGLNGAGPQQAAINALQQMPAFQSQLKLGENRILANASATGGLRGGNTQAAMGYFGPQLLAQQINDQYARLGGITSLGQNSAALTGNAGMQTGQGISGLLQQAGAAQAGAALAGGRATSGMINSVTSGLGQLQGSGTLGRIFGGTSPAPDAVNLGTSTGADMDVFF